MADRSKRDDADADDDEGDGLRFFLPSTTEWKMA